MLTIPPFVVLPDNRALTREQFFAERDHRTQIVERFARQRARVGVLIAPGLQVTSPGQTATLWAASMVRRMGEPFAGVRLIGESLMDAPYLAALHASRGLQQFGAALQLELRGADPFSDFEVHEYDQAASKVGLDAAIVIGGNARVESIPCVRLAAHGWVVYFSPASSDDEPDHGFGFDCAAASAIASVSLAVARIYLAMQGRLVPLIATATPETDPNDPPFWWSVDTGLITTDPTEGESWFARGSSSSDPAPWAAASGSAPETSRIAFVSAGGIGGNLAQILAASFIQPGIAAIIDPDKIDIGNLNRLIGVVTTDVGSHKTAVFARELHATGFATDTANEPYEDWAARNRQFLESADCVSVVGADQVTTRLESQADWPLRLFNGSTAALTWRVSQHSPGAGGCLGCLFAPDRRPYAVTRGPQACAAAGGGPSPVAAAVLADASYPFVSVCTAAVLAAQIIRNAAQSANLGNGAASPCNAIVTEMSMATPVNARTRPLAVHRECLLLCSHEAVRPLLSSMATPISL